MCKFFSIVCLLMGISTVAHAEDRYKIDSVICQSGALANRNIVKNEELVALPLRQGDTRISPDKSLAIVTQVEQNSGYESGGAIYPKGDVAVLSLHIVK